MATTIQISQKLQEELTKRKLYAQETYEEVIWDLIEDTLELSEETRREIRHSREEIRAGKAHALPEVKRKLGI